jgi:NDP-sugar pyrophosphorylase family protein
VALETMAPKAVILAAGRGERLRPLTDGPRKPMLPIGERPLLVAAGGLVLDDFSHVDVP